MLKFPDGFTPYKKKDADRYNTFRWWSGLTFGDLVDRAADIHPETGNAAPITHVVRTNNTKTRIHRAAYIAGLLIVWQNYESLWIATPALSR